MHLADHLSKAPWAEQINETKLSPPQLSLRQVERTSLLRKLDASADLPLVLIRGPAGYGKSITVAQWFEHMRQRGEQVAWLSVDTLDNSTQRLLSHLIASFSQLQANFGHHIRGQLNTPGKLSLPALAATITLEISSMASIVHCVLDDFHLIDNEEIISLFTLLLENPPANLRLIIVSRMSLPMPTSRLKAANQFVEFTVNDLQFDVEEVSKFILLENNLQLPEETAIALAQKTEGWIAGLKLTSLSLVDQTDVAGFISSFSGPNRDIASFLAEEVLARLAESSRDFLLKTAVLDRMCPDLCNHLTGRTDAEQELTGLEKSGLFIIPLDKEGTWYRYHHLFAEFLLRTLNASQPGSAKALYATASQFKQHRKSVRANAIFGIIQQ